jgi:hypothetical protein
MNCNENFFLEAQAVYLMTKACIPVKQNGKKLVLCYGNRNKALRQNAANTLSRLSTAGPELHQCGYGKE